MKSFKTSFLVLIIWTFTSLSCKTNQALSSNVIYVENLHQLIENPGKFLGKIIELEGNYLGWSGSGCNYIQNYAHQITRSDWTFRDTDGNCIFVTGGKPVFLSPLENEDNEKKIKLIAKLREDKENKFYLEFVSAKSK
ncbi:MAG: hypothetical protein P1P88_15215 [Bacteroidales bacterium]|nr:hypothetical protein [Bacteroidales bacterium]